MSTSEVTAYLAGVELARTAEAYRGTTGLPDPGTELEPTPELVAARERLGERAFLYWVVRGASDQQKDR